jgi:hypothetical protein
MGLFKRKPVDIPSPEDWAKDPQAAIKRAMGGTDTYTDEHGRRRKLDEETREDIENLRPPRRPGG